MTLSKKIILALSILIAVGAVAGAIGAHAVVDIKVMCPDGSDTCTLGNPLAGGTNDITGLICLIISFLSTKLMPPVVVLMVLWASFLFLTAAGQPGKIVQARTVLLWAVIGTAILLMAVPLVSLVVSTVGGTAPAQCSGTTASASALSVFYTLINWFTWLLAILSVAVGLYAGFLYMTSRGEPQKVALAGRVIFYAVVGILVAIIAFSILTIIKTMLPIP